MIELKWQPGEALRYAAEDYHNREYWADSNRDHTTRWIDCPEETCTAIRKDLENIIEHGYADACECYERGFDSGMSTCEEYDY